MEQKLDKAFILASTVRLTKPLLFRTENDVVLFARNSKVRICVCLPNAKKIF